MKLRAFIHYSLLLLISYFSAGVAAQPSASTTPEPMVVRYLEQQGFDEHYAYRYELTRAALEVTRVEFGDYQIQTYTASASTERYVHLMKSGEQLNVIWVSPGDLIESTGAIEIPVDILKGLLGYRVCLINRNSTMDFSAIKDLAGLNHVRIGQGLWPDRAIYKANQLTTVDAPNFENLFFMLDAQRFDCIALGVDEVVRIYESQQATHPLLAIDKHLLIHYNYPLYFYVSKQYPDLARRLALGLQKLQASGALEEMFNRYHLAKLAPLNLPARNLVCLTSPHPGAQESCSLLQLKAFAPTKSTGP